MRLRPLTHLDPIQRFGAWFTHWLLRWSTQAEARWREHPLRGRYY